VTEAFFLAKFSDVVVSSVNVGFATLLLLFEKYRCQYPCSTNNVLRRMRFCSPLDFMLQVSIFDNSSFPKLMASSFSLIFGDGMFL